MKFTYSMLIIFIGNFIIQYVVMSYVMLNSSTHFTTNMGKVYLASIIGVLMVILDRAMMDHRYNVFSLNLYLFLFSLLALMIYLYRIQWAINDKEYLKGMVENHSNGLLMSEKILKKTDNYHVAKLAKNILSQQAEELDKMKDMLSK